MTAFVAGQLPLNENTKILSRLSFDVLAHRSTNEWIVNGNAANSGHLPEVDQGKVED